MVVGSIHSLEGVQTQFPDIHINSIQVRIGPEPSRLRLILYHIKRYTPCYWDARYAMRWNSIVALERFRSFHSFLGVSSGDRQSKTAISSDGKTEKKRTAFDTHCQSHDHSPVSIQS